MNFFAAISGILTKTNIFFSNFVAFLKNLNLFLLSDPRIVPHFYANPWGDNYYGDLYEYPVTSPPATRYIGLK